MKVADLKTQNPDVNLVEPDIERNAALGVRWLDGELGYSAKSYSQTLKFF